MGNGAGTLSPKSVAETVPSQPSFVEKSSPAPKSPAHSPQSKSTKPTPTKKEVEDDEGEYDGERNEIDEKEGNGTMRYKVPSPPLHISSFPKLFLTKIYCRMEIYMLEHLSVI